MKTSDREKLDTLQNPFLTSITFTAREVTITNQMVNVNDIDEGIITRLPSTLKSSLIIDDSRYTKVFVKQALRLHINNLSSNAKSVFLFVTYEVDPGCDYFEINKKRYIAECNSNYKLLSNGIKELIDASVIVATSVSDVYWINPLLIFSGDRLKKYPKNVTTK